MKRFFLLIACLSLSIVLLAQESDTETLQPIRTIEGEFSSVLLYFDTIQQGRASFLQVMGDFDSVSGSVFGRDLTFFIIPNQAGQFAFIAVSMEQATNSYELQVRPVKDGLEQLYQIQLKVESGGFQTQDVLLFEKAELVNEDLERNEFEQIFSIAVPSGDAPQWMGEGFSAPVQGELSSPFGLDRTFNGFLRTRHTGWDVNIQTGMPVFAMAGGTVAFAGKLPIRGNYVLIDHGAGVYSGYAHFAVTHVTQGQTVSAGQVIGQVGTSGRSSSSHAHFETIVDGLWVDPVDFIRLPLPH